jgi:hypothetical protein
LKSLKVSKEVLEEAEREGSSREFFFKLVELLSGGSLKRREIKALNHRELILKIVEENGLLDYFFPSKAKNIYSALRNAFRLKERAEVEREWEGKLKSWREEFEEVLLKSANAYLVKVKDWELLRELYKKGWLLSSNILNLYDGREPFEEWILKVSTEEFLENLLNSWLSIPPFKRREKILRDVLKAYRLGCTELSIYGLFPQCEGVVWDAFVKDNAIEADVERLIRKRNRKFVTIQYALKLLLQEIFKEEELPPFLEHLPFVDYQEGVLNRHAIGHGVAVNFGSRENFLKLFYFLGFLAEVLGHALKPDGKS